MNTTLIFGAGVAATGAICLGVIFYFAPRLRKLLVELCGSADRADFWLAFSNVMLFLVPVIFAFWAAPDPAQNLPGLMRISDQLKWALAGLMASVLTMGIVLSAYIPPASVKQ